MTSVNQGKIKVNESYVCKSLQKQQQQLASTRRQGLGLRLSVFFCNTCKQQKISKLNNNDAIMHSQQQIRIIGFTTLLGRTEHLANILFSMIQCGV